MGAVHAGMAAQPIFIFGFPRSGTTLLQRFLNSYDDVLIWGEHVFFLKDIANAYFRVWRNPDFFKGTVVLDDVLADARSLTRWQAWMNWIREDDWKRLYREFMESVFVPRRLPGRRFWGWKEVHYSAAPNDPTLPFLADVFPEAIFVFLVRSGFNTMASYSVRPLRRNIVDWSREGCHRWTTTIRSFHDWHRSGGVESFWLRYEDLVLGEGEVLRLLERMGKPLGEVQREILEAETARGSSFGTADYNERWKQLSTFRQAIALTTLGKLNRELGYPNPPVPLLARLAGATASPLLTTIYFATRLLSKARQTLSSPERPRRDHPVTPAGQPGL